MLKSYIHAYAKGQLSVCTVVTGSSELLLQAVITKKSHAVFSQVGVKRYDLLTAM